MAVAAVAMAASLFAVDVAAQLMLKTNLFDSATKTILTDPESTGFDKNNTYAKFSASADRAGGSFIIKDIGKELTSDDPKVTIKDNFKDFGDMTLWFQPVDALKVTVGAVETGSLVRGTFAWWHRSVRVEKDAAIALNANVGPVAIEFVNWGPLADFNAEGYAMLGNFFLAGNIGLGDAGTIQVVAEKGADLSAYGVGGWEGSDLTAFGVAYDHMPWQQTGFYADAYVAFANSDFAFTKVVSQIGGQYCGNGLALRLSNMIAYGQAYGNGVNNFYYGFVARAQYAIDSVTPYVEVKGHEIMDKKCEVNAGAVINVGACEIDASFHTAIEDGKEFAFNIPVQFKVSF